MKTQLSIAHVVNPCVVPTSSDLYIAQPVTFESMRRAKQATEGKVRVTIYSAQFPEAHSAVPEFMIKLPDLMQSVEHTGKNGIVRKLPLLKEILDGIYHQATDADYIIYTNADIALQLHFYVAVAEKIHQGYDAFEINRRTISDRFTSIGELEQMYFDKGEKHPGFDCFIFKREFYPNFILNGIAIGIPPVARLLLSNMAVFSKRFYIYSDEFLTFHIGNDGQWMYLDTVSLSQLNNRRIAIKHMISLLWRGRNLQQKMFILKNIFITFLFGNPWLTPIRPLIRQTIKFLRSRHGKS